MTTEDMITEIYNFAYKFYKRNRNCLEGRKLDRHESVKIENNIFSYWKEYVMFKVAEFLQDKLPFAIVECTLDGNNTTIDLTCSDVEQTELNSRMTSLILDIRRTGYVY